MRCEAKTLGIDAYILPKVTGTRFVGHRFNGVKMLFHNWTALSNSIKKEVVCRCHVVIQSGPNWLGTSKI